MKAELETVSDNIERIERMHTQALVCFNEEQSRQISRDLSRLKSETQKRNYDIRNRLKGELQGSTVKQLVANLTMFFFRYASIQHKSQRAGRSKRSAITGYRSLYLHSAAIFILTLLFRRKRSGGDFWRHCSVIRTWSVCTKRSIDRGWSVKLG